MKIQNIYYTVTSLRSLFIQIVFTVNALYYVVDANLNALQLVLIGTILEATIFLFEIPTGLIADHFGRKRSLFIGTLIIGIAHVFEGTFPSFWSIAIASGLWGIGWTFISGAEEAWIADELNGKDLNSVFLKGAQFESLGQFLGILISVCLATLFSVKISIIIAGIMLILLSLGAFLIMPETKFIKITHSKDITTIRHLFITIRDGANQIRGNTILISLAVITVLWGLASEGYDRLWGARFIEDFHLSEETSVYWFGAFYAITFLLNMIILKYIERHIHKNYSVILLIINSLLTIMVLIFAFSSYFTLAIVTYLMASTLRKVYYPISSTMTNERLASKGRATALSMFGQLDAIGQIVGGPIIGVIALYTSISYGIASSALLILPIILCLFVMIKKEN